MHTFQSLVLLFNEGTWMFCPMVNHLNVAARETWCCDWINRSIFSPTCWSWLSVWSKMFECFKNAKLFALVKFNCGIMENIFTLSAKIKPQTWPLLLRNIWALALWSRGRGFESRLDFFFFPFISGCLIIINHWESLIRSLKELHLFELMWKLKLKWPPSWAALGEFRRQA